MEAWLKDRHKTPYDVIIYNDVTSALNSYELRRNKRYTGV